MFYILVFLLGGCFGSFFCLVIERLSKGESIIRPGSHCSICLVPLNFFEMIPVLSILFLRFRCRHCGSRLSAVYLVGELGFSSLSLWFVSGTFTFQQWLLFIWLISAILLSLTDLLLYLVEPWVLYPATLLMLCLSLAAGLPVNWIQPSIFLLLSLLLMKILPNSFGGGDVQLLMCWSLFLDLHQLSLLLFFASSLGLATLLLCQSFKRPQKKLPFVPYLTAALILIQLFS